MRPLWTYENVGQIYFFSFQKQNYFGNGRAIRSTRYFATIPIAAKRGLAEALNISRRGYVSLRYPSVSFIKAPSAKSVRVCYHVASQRYIAGYLRKG